MESNSSYILEETDFHKIMNYLISSVSVEEVLEKIDPRLKTIYDNRSLQYSKTMKEQNESVNVKLNKPVSFVKIPMEKMNNEERLLTACLSQTNMRNDLNELLEYFYNMYDVVYQTNKHKEELLNRYEDEVVKMILNCGMKNFFSSKLKLYIDEPEEEKPEEKKDRVPMTEEEIKKELEELESHPMFMTEIPENAEDNKYLQALQALKFEGNPEDVAIEFMEKSKESLEKYKSSNKFFDLKESMYYICNAIDHVKDDSTVPNQVKYDLYFHRAEIQVMVKNKGHAVDDLKSALFYVQEDDAYMMLIECYISLEAFDRATKIIEQRKKKLVELEIPECKNKLVLYGNEEKKISAIKHQLLQDLEKMEAFKNMDNKQKFKLYEILTKKGIKLKSQIHNIPSTYETKIYIDEDSKIHFPILIIYEEFNMTDYIQDFPEDSFISDILDILLGEDNFLPWDKEHKYSKNTCLCFYEVSEIDPILKAEKNYYYPMRNDDRLIDVLTNKKIYMNGIPVIHIVSHVTNHFQHFMKNKIIIKRK